MSASSAGSALGVEGGPSDAASDQDRTTAKRPDQSLGALVTEMSSELSTLFRKEIELAKTEAREEASHAGKAAALLGGAAAGGLLALMLLSLALAWLLDDELGLDRGLAFALVGLAWVVAAWMMQRVGRNRLAQVRGLPETKRSMKEDVEWAKAQKQLRREIEDTRGDLGYTLDAIGDRLSPGRMIERRKNRVMGGLRDVRERVMGTADEASSAVGRVGATVGGAGEEVVDTVRTAPSALRQQTQGNPLAAGAVSFGIGVLLASLFPATATEEQAADHLVDKAQPLKDELIDTGKDMAEHLREPARQALDQVKDVAAEGTESVAGAAKSVADTTSQTARRRAGNPLRYDRLLTRPPSAGTR